MKGLSIVLAGFITGTLLSHPRFGRLMLCPHPDPLPRFLQN